MSPFEAHVLIQQAPVLTSPFSSGCSSSTNTTGAQIGENLAPTNNNERILLEALKSCRLNPNLHFKKESLLSTAIKKGCSNVVKLFLEHGADPNLKSYENGRYEPALITAVRYKSLRCVQILLEHGANQRQTNFYGTDAIYQAVHENAFEILNYLLLHEDNEQGQPRGNFSFSKNYCQPQQSRQRKDVPRAKVSLSSSSSSPALLLPPPLPSSVIARQTTAPNTKIGGQEPTKISSRPAAKDGLNREQPFNNKSSNSNNSSKGHDVDYYDDDDYDDDNDDHVLCPFYYALQQALPYPSKRISLGLLLQSYYKCKCVQEITSGCSSSTGSSSRSSTNAAANMPKKLLQTNFPILDDHHHHHHHHNELQECLRLVRLLSSENFFPCASSAAGRKAKSVPRMGRQADDDHHVRQQQQREHYYGTHHRHHHRDTLLDVDNENDIRFQLSLTTERGQRGGEENELMPRPPENLYLYKVYKIQGKCHAIKENELSTSSSPSLQSRPATNYVVLVGPLKLSCISREVIRDQIRRTSRPTISTQTACLATTSTNDQNDVDDDVKTTQGSASSSNESTNCHSGRSKAVAPPHYHPHHHLLHRRHANDKLITPLQSEKGEDTTAVVLECGTTRADNLKGLLLSRKQHKRNFRQSCETLMLPSPLKDYILYGNISWNGTLPPRKKEGGGSGRDTENNNETLHSSPNNSSNGIDNIQLIKRDPELNTNHYAIYIY